MIAVCSPGFLPFYWSAGFETFLQVAAIASHWLEDCAMCKFYTGGNQYSANHSSAMKVACQSTFINAHL